LQAATTRIPNVAGIKGKRQAADVAELKGEVRPLRSCKGSSRDWTHAKAEAVAIRIGRLQSAAGVRCSNHSALPASAC